MNMSNDSEEFHTIDTDLRNSVWNEMYENERVSRYYQELLKKHHNIDLCIRTSTVLMAVLMVIVNVTAPEIWVKVVSALPFLGLYIADSQIKFTKTRYITSIRNGCAVIGTMLKDLWNEMESGQLNNEAVEFKLSHIRQTEVAIVTKHTLEAKIVENRRLNIKCAEEARDDMIDLYEGASA